MFLNRETITDFTSSGGIAGKNYPVDKDAERNFDPEREFNGSEIHILS